MGLTLQESELMNLIEQFYYKFNRIPTLPDLQGHYGTGGLLTWDLWQNCLKNDLFKKGLIKRGLEKFLETYDLEPPKELPAGILPPVGLKNVISGLQLEFINLVLDSNDKRDIGSKMRSLGINKSQYQAWLKDSDFAAFYRNRAENLFGDQLPEVHSALQRKAVSGDVNAIKLAYEVTGFHTEKPDKDFDPRWFISQILEILQKKLAGQPELLDGLSDELLGLLRGIGAINPAIEQRYSLMGSGI